jgi:para-aminobenzoate synthetase component 1
MTIPAPLHVLPLALPDPLAAFAAVAGGHGAMLLDGGAADAGRARYSILACDPFSWIEVAGDGTVRRDGTALNAGPFTALRDALAPFRRAVPGGLPAFTGGAVGFMGYELGRHLERLPTPRATGLDLPDMAFGLYDTVAVIDHATAKAWVISGGEREADIARRADRARGLAQALLERLRTAPALAQDAGDGLLRRPGWEAEIAPADYRTRVARILDYIRAGDIYQANMTQRFQGRLRAGVTAWDTYRRLRPRTAAPFSAFLNLGHGRAVASGSPERFLSLTADGALRRARSRAPAPAMPTRRAMPPWPPNCWRRRRIGRKT